MARLKIRVNEENGKTQSKFATTNIDKVIFKNDGSKALSVTIQGATENDSPLCDVDGDPVPSFGVPRNRTEVLWVCGDWSEFKYTAQITGTQAEDPVVIIERRSSLVPGTEPVVIFEKSGPIGGSEALVGAAGLALGVLVGFVLSRTLGHRTPRT